MLHLLEISHVLCLQSDKDKFSSGKDSTVQINLKNVLVAKIGERVGGLSKQVDAIVRRALATRLYPPELTRPLGLSPARNPRHRGP